MRSAKADWLVWLLFFSLFLFFFSEVNGRRACGRSQRKIKLPAHTRIASRQRKAKYATLTCDKGYYFSKGKSVKDIPCKNFKNLSANRIPKCRGCGQPPSLKNGTVKFPNDSVGSVAVYSCDVGYSLKGLRKQRRCRRNLRWSGGRARISCKKNRCSDPGNISLRNGNIAFSDRLFEEFTTLSFECDDDYELLGEEDSVCLKGQWSAKLPYCRRKRCSRPVIPENGRMFGSKFFIGSTVEFFCNSGFLLYGSRKRTCQDDKTWNGTVTVCDDGSLHCRNPGTPIGAIKSGKKYNEGDIVYYSCKPGLKLFEGSQNRTCLKNKTWSGTPPRCVDKDYKVFRPIDETAQLFAEGFVNSLIQTTCSGTNVSCPIPDTRARALNLKYKEGLDLIFVLDTSSSITPTNFEIARELVKTIVEIFGVDPRANGDGTHIACVTYGTRAENQFTFNAAEVQTLDKALNRIDRIQYTRGATATRLALDMVRNLILPSAKRPGSTKALFLVTDGESNVGGSPKKAADVLKNEENVEIYVIGIGKKVRDQSLRELASEDKNVFAVASFKDLKKVKKKVVNRPVKDYSECGTSPFKPFDARARVVGGKKANERNWPWAVRVIVRGKPECGGTIINREFVLTAAHCFDGEPKVKNHDVKVLFQDKDSTVHTSLDLYVHQDYRQKNYKNDIALIKFPELKRFTRNQQAICLPREINTTNIIQAGNEMYAVGWGGTKSVQPGHRAAEADLSKHLKQVKLPFKASTFCDENVKNKTASATQKKKGNWYFNSTTQFCAGDVTGQKDTCHGDSGGPGMVLQPLNGKWRWFQVGIVSWGIGCAQKGEVGYYTKVSSYLDWINNIITS